jgi:hypothetical protein
MRFVLLHYDFGHPRRFRLLLMMKIITGPDFYHAGAVGGALVL